MQDNISKVRAAYQQSGSTRGAAKILGWTRKKARYWLEKAAEEPFTTPEGTEVEYTGRIKSIEDLAREMNIDFDKWGVDTIRLNCWEALDGEGQIQQLFQVRANVYPSLALQPAEFDPVRIASDTPELIPRDICLVIPDTQHGFTRNKLTNKLTPFHDTAAWAAMLDSAERCRPAEVILLGDHLDLNEWSSKYTRSTDHWFTTQAAIQALHDDLADLRRVVGPACRIRYIEGNHEHRLQVMLQDKIPQLAALAGANSIDPVVSVQSLLRLDELNIEYVGPYGAETWLWDRVRFHHGSVVRSGAGATATAVIKGADYSEVFGHIHRCELTYKTINGPNGQNEIFVMTPGTLSRIDGAVPPGRRTDWQQGFAYISRDEDGVIWPRIVRVRNGRYLQWP